jgi:hypothetical protein
MRAIPLLLQPFNRSFLSAFEFARRARQVHAKLSGSDIRMRREATKQFVEEVVPLSVFALWFQTASRTVRVRHCAGNQRFDAKLRVDERTGEVEVVRRDYHVEVTVACDLDDYLARECLERNGFRYYGGPLERIGYGRSKTVKSSLRAVDPDDRLIEIAQNVERCLERKASNEYPPHTILVVALAGEYRSIEEIAAIGKRFSEHPGRRRFGRACLLDSSTNLVVPF